MHNPSVRDKRTVCSDHMHWGIDSHLPARATVIRASMNPRVVTRDSRCSSEGMKYVYPVGTPPGQTDT